ncbi:MAG TPA: Gfo/Idh/MocA family oxidoreductase [Candidatus Limnocylindrales bacterium]|nr:Gfo/Idh/MocA family oxidoreductase [Candidatus Limnocylindrales bacterium]
MRVALLGAGRIGQLHGQLLASQSAVDEVVVWDIDDGRARQTAESIGGQSAPSLDEALRDADSTVIAASTDAHAGLVRASVGRGLPTFCEKPLAFDLPETVELVEYIEASGVAVQVGFQRRFDPAYREARRLVASGEIGTVYLVRLIAHDHEPPPDGYIPISGGLFRDSSIHDFDALRWLTGQEVEEVYAAGSVRGFPIFARHDDVDTAAAVLRLADGSLGVLSQTRHDPLGYDVRMEIVGSRDAVTVGLGQRTPLRSLEPDAPDLAGPAWQTFIARFEDAYREELLAFVGVASGEAASPCTARDALEAMRISVAAGRSCAEGRPIRVMDA